MVGVPMGTNRMEAFSDGVLAVIITIMVLELKLPQGADLSALAPLLPTLLGYVLSFVYVGIYWNNHHHMLHATQRVNGRILWANLHLLFWLSLVPLITTWLGEHPSAPVPAAVYGAVLCMAGLAFLVLQRAIVALNGRDSTLAKAVGTDIKELASLLLYLVGIGAAFLRPWIAELLYAVVAVMWVIPDPRIERAVTAAEPRPH